MTTTRRPRSIAFYLPQFHPIPENDEWWEPGFTEWTNVVKGRPRFKGHAQPHLPADLGFYDLRLPEVRRAQADLAAAHGIDAFCYYHYWFEGRRLLERPFEEMLASGDPDLPFCLCWANEEWTRAWSGSSGTVLMRQGYSAEDDLRHVRSLLPAFADERYLRLDGKPVFLVYRASRLPDPVRTTDIWRTEVARATGQELFLCRVESFRSEHGDPRRLGFDAAVDFQPDRSIVRPPMWRSVPRRAAHHARLTDRRLVRYTTYDYGRLVERALNRPEPAYRRFPCVTPGWDNTARRDEGAIVLTGSTPELYGHWLAEVSKRPDADLVFVNAWNEWGEGCHLEPCQQWGRSYLEAHRAVARPREPAT